ncbi:MAG TPA: efflux transporter outer membrane subunit [Alphaproteobacteria bacterium]|nr:multidrug transporter [Rhodospirillaceae bacterium]HRJ67397.1 efflux transporter outer membrane subunit [Alphaproteobacteria bacterium]
MRKQPFIAALMLTTFLGGCNMIPEYLRPASPVAAAWPSGAAYQAPAELAAKSAVETGWQEFFRSQNLQRLIGAALENNRDLRVAALNVEAARAAYRVQRAELVPSVQAGTGMSRQGVPENASSTGRDAISSQYTANVATTAFELDVFGRIRSLNEKALQDYLATDEARKSVQIALVAEVANAYLSLLADEKLLKLTEETLAAQQESFTLIERSFDAGIGSQLDVSQARTSVETARTNLAQYKRRVAQDKNALALLVGAADVTVDTANETLDDTLIMENLPAGLPSDVLLNRPDVLQAEYTLKGANANIGAARAAFFPRISLTGSLGLASSSLSDLFKSGSGLAWSFAPQLTVPIFEGGANVANLELAETQQKIAVASYEKAIQTAFREVADELAARGTYSDQLQAQSALVGATQNAYDLSQLRYKQGVDSYLNVLDAQRSLYSAQQGEIQVQQQRLSNLVTLYKTLGGGLK